MDDNRDYQDRMAALLEQATEDERREACAMLTGYLAAKQADRERQAGA